MKERDDLEATLIDIEVDVSPLKVWRVRSPGGGLPIARFNGKPSLVTETIAMLPDLKEKQVERVVVGLLIDGHNRATNLLAV